jgi:hypothetical protein
MDRRILVYSEKSSPIAAVTSMEAVLAVSRLQGDKLLVARSPVEWGSDCFWEAVLLRNGIVLRYDKKF